MVFPVFIVQIILQAKSKAVLKLVLLAVQQERIVVQQIERKKAQTNGWSQVMRFAVEIVEIIYTTGYRRQEKVGNFSENANCLTTEITTLVVRKTHSPGRSENIESSSATEC